MGFTTAAIVGGALAVGNSMYQAKEQKKEQKRMAAAAQEAAKRNVTVEAKQAAVARQEDAARVSEVNSLSEKRRRLSASQATVSGLSVLGGLTSGGRKTLG